MVFTIPEPLKPLTLQNQRLVYGLLFREVSQTLLEIAADPRRLGAHVGFLAVLHTEPEPAEPAPYSLRGPSRGPCARRGPLDPLPPEVLLTGSGAEPTVPRQVSGSVARCFCGGKLEFHGQLIPLRHSTRFHALLRQLKSIKWVVYAKHAKPPFGGPEYVLKYLARYTHRGHLQRPVAGLRKW